MRATLIVAVLALSACDHGNIKPTSSYHAPAAPPVRNALYNPYAAYGEANAIWQPPAFNRGRHRRSPGRARLAIRPARL